MSRSAGSTSRRDTPKDMIALAAPCRTSPFSCSIALTNAGAAGGPIPAKQEMAAARITCFSSLSLSSKAGIAGSAPAPSWASPSMAA